jgi:DNA polymerase III delta prime subunit
MSWRERFGMQAAPLPRGAAGDTFFDQDPHYQRLARAFAWLAAEPGIGVLTGEPGVGKTSAMRHLCRQLPGSEHRVVYLCDCAVKPLDLYRMLAAELGLRPGPRAQIVADIKRALVSLVDDRGVVPIVILDDAQGLRENPPAERERESNLNATGRPRPGRARDGALLHCSLGGAPPSSDAGGPASGAEVVLDDRGR